jgi:hypothetical protein
MSKDSRFEEMYNAIFERAPEVFKEFEFHKSGRGSWISNNTYRTNGTTGKSKGKVEYHPNTRGFYEKGCFVHLREYVANRDQVSGSDLWRRLFELADMSGDWIGSGGEPADLRRDVWESITARCAWELHNNPSERAEAVRKYLLEKRGYSAILQPGTPPDLGFWPGGEVMKQHLSEFPADIVEEILAILPGGEGSSHPLTIARRAPGGAVAGLKFRRVDEQKANKYLATKGAKIPLSGVSRRDVSGGRLVLVEGELDCFSARFNGFPNVAAIGGNQFSGGLRAALDELGVKDVVVCMDADAGGGKGIANLLRELLPRERFGIFFAHLPEGKDVDELLAHNPRGKEIFEEALRTAEAVETYLSRGVDELLAKEVSEGASDDAMRATAAEKVGEIYAMFPGAREGERERFLARALKVCEPYNLTRSDVMLRVGDNERTADERRGRGILTDFGELVGQIVSSTTISPQNAVKRLKQAFEKSEAEIVTGKNFSFWRERYGREEFLAEVAQIGEGLRSGLWFGGNEMLLPQGVNVVAAPTGHGKTWVLINLLLNAAEIYPSKTFHFFTFEMPREQIALRFLSAFCDEIVAPRRNDTAIARYLKTGNPAELAVGAVALQGFETKVARFYELIEARRLCIHSEPLDVRQLCAAITSIAEEEEVGAVAVDYMQLLSLPAEEARNNRHEDIKQICLLLKDAAIQTRLPLIVASQFKRDVASPLNMGTTSVSEGSDIEKIAALMVGVWNGGESKYEFKPTDKSQTRQAPDIVDGQLWFNSLKVRSGEKFNGLATFNGATGRISAPGSKTKTSNPFDLR